MPHSFFRSSGYTAKPIIQTSDGNEFDLSTLSPFLRTLRVMDGTVTKALSAWFWEPIRVVSIHNKIEVLDEGIEGLKVSTGDLLLRREVALCGDKSQQTFACARSQVSLGHLPSSISESLKKGEMGIGELLRENGIETYRDIFNLDYQQHNLTDPILSGFDCPVFSRSYRIRVNQIPAIIVTEFFPIDQYS